MALNRPAAPRRPVRLAEVVGVLSLAADLGSGATLEHGLRTCLVALRVVERAGGDDDALRSAYWLSLLRLIGCNSTAHTLAALIGDELAPSGWFGAIDFADPKQVLGRVLANVGAGEAPMTRLARLARVLASLPSMRSDLLAHCEVALLLARRLPLPEAERELLGYLFERWNGVGPRGLRGESTPFVARAVTFAHDVATWCDFAPREELLPEMRRRAGRTTDPELVAILERDANILAPLELESAWHAVLEAEPGSPRWLAGADLDEALICVAEFADMKIAPASTHSRRIARLVAEGAREAGLPAGPAATLSRAALLHDVGRSGISAGVWDLPRPLRAGEWEQVRLHPHYTDRVLAPAAGLREEAEVAPLSAERVDGSGYHRRLGGAALPLAARVLAAADVFAALGEDRPHRAALPIRAAVERLGDEAREGRLDPDAVAAVLRCAGEAAEPPRRRLPAGLTERETEVLALIATGLSNRQVAERLHLAEKTVGNHVQHVYEKIGVSTRAAATLFAVQQDLV